MKLVNTKLAVLGLGLAAAGAAQAERDIEEVRDLDARGHLSVYNVAGEIEIST